MGWFKVDDQLAFHQKTVTAGNAAMGLWVRAGSWSCAQLTGGFIANAMANAMANECDIDALVQSGLWDEVDGGYQFHDWSEFQPSAEIEKEKRKARSLAGKKGAEARWGKKDDGEPMANAMANRMANGWQKDAPDPDPSISKDIERAPSKKCGSRITEDWLPQPETIQKLKAEYPHIDQKLEHRKFVDHWLAESGSKASKLDWEATYRNWIRRSAEYNPAPTKQSGSSPWDQKGIHQ